MSRSPVRRSNVIQIPADQVRRRGKARRQPALTIQYGTHFRQVKTRRPRKATITAIPIRYTDTAIDTPDTQEALHRARADDEPAATAVVDDDVPYGPGDGYAVAPGVARARPTGVPSPARLSLYDKWNNVLPLIQAAYLRARADANPVPVDTACACQGRNNRVVCVFLKRSSLRNVYTRR